MHDPKFEKEVQQKMHDLEFVPSESVWAGIQQGIAPGERRRRIAVLWWLFPGMLLLGGGVMFYRHPASTSKVAAAAPKPLPARSAPAGEPGKAVRDGSSGEMAANENGAGGREALKPSFGDLSQDQKASERAARPLGVTGMNRMTEMTRVSEMNGKSGTTRVTGMTRATGLTRVSEVNGESGAQSEKSVGMGGDGGVAGENAYAKRAANERFDPVLIGGIGVRRGVSAPYLNVPNKTAVNGIGQARHPWLVGFAAGVGGSTVYSPTGNALVAHSPLNGYSGSSSSTSPSNPNVLLMRANYSWAPAYGAKRNGSNVSLGYSYWAGIYGERQLSARWAVDIGLNLHYYSVQYQTENPINAYAPTSASLLVPTAVTYAVNPSNAYGGSGEQTYVNRYYFLEVPATAQWKLNRSVTLPLFWRGGAVLSYLMSSNGLYFDNSFGEYKSDNSVMRHAQASVISGFAVGLPLKGVRMQAGPEVQYALTSLLKYGPGGGHLLYGGIRVSLMR